MRHQRRGSEAMFWVGAVFMLAAFVVMGHLAVLGWQHPDMTERRFFLEFWREELLCAGLWIASMWSFASAK